MKRIVTWLTDAGILPGLALAQGMVVIALALVVVVALWADGPGLVRDILDAVQGLLGELPLGKSGS